VAGRGRRIRPITTTIAVVGARRIEELAFVDAAE
jgi:hypothetical protein